MSSTGLRIEQKIRAKLSKDYKTPSDSPDDIFFLNGWIGERLVEEWLKLKGYAVKRATRIPRGTKNATSSGDIDLVAKKGSEVRFVEVKSWSKKYRLGLSWLVEFMLDRK